LKITDIDRRIADLIAINPRPSQPSALVEMGRDLLSRDVEAATKCFDKAIAIDPRHVPAWVGRSEALCLLGRKGQAVGCLERAIDVDPKNGDLAERKSKLLAELAVASSRNRRFEPPSSQNPVAQPAPSSSRLVVKEETKPAQKIEKPAEKPLEKPVEPKIEKKIEKKVEPKVEAAPPPPSEPKFEIELDTKPKSEPKPEPKSEPKPAPKSDPTPAPVSEPRPERRADGPLEEASMLFANGKHIEALRKVEPLSKQPDASADVWMLRAEICAALDQREAEIDSYTKATKAEPKNVSAWLALALARAAMKRHEKALDAADQALLLAPFDGKVQKIRGQLLMGLGQGTAAVAAFEKATQHAADDAEAFLELGRALRAVKKPDAARDVLRRALGIAESMSPELVPAVRVELEKLK
jgi:tetratricopeptide (TPR) repeat protein